MERFPRIEERYFTEAERAYCHSRRRRTTQHFAARLAAKLACRALLGSVALKDIEVIRDELGAPHITLYGGAQQAGSGVVYRISLSHDEDVAAALVVGESA